MGKKRLVRGMDMGRAVDIVVIRESGDRGGIVVGMNVDKVVEGRVRGVGMRTGANPVEDQLADENGLFDEHDDVHEDNGPVAVGEDALIDGTSQRAGRLQTQHDQTERARAFELVDHPYLRSPHQNGGEGRNDSPSAAERNDGGIVGPKHGQENHRNGEDEHHAEGIDEENNEMEAVAFDVGFNFLAGNESVMRTLRVGGFSARMVVQSNNVKRIQLHEASQKLIEFQQNVLAV